MGRIRKTLGELKRCPWPGTEPIYLDYHDREWGVPERDSRALFEKLLLDGFQAGLSWITILKKRENFRRAFDGFVPAKMARYTPARVDKLLGDAGIIRHRGKIEAAVGNARAYLQIDDFSGYLWQFVAGRPKVNRWRSIRDLPAETAESRAMSKNLRARGFTFVGPTICYAFMQAVGMVNDHLVGCFRYDEV
jgi:DNA-3-methyladenine glycosylase I